MCTDNSFVEPILIKEMREIMILENQDFKKIMVLGRHKFPF